MAWLYILECNDGSYYVGSTTDLERRLAEHKSGEGGLYTALRLPVKLIYHYEVASIEDAFYLEREVKGWRRAKKQALIRHDYSALVQLSKSSIRQSQGMAPMRAKETARPSTGSGRR